MESKCRNIDLRIEDIQPNLRFINLFQCRPGFYSGERMLYDYYFLYIHKGKGTIIIDEREYKAILGDLFYCSPGVLNSIKADESDPFLLTGINFDFTQNHRDNKLLYPIQKELFQSNYITEHVHFIDFKGFPNKINLADDANVREIIYNMVQQYNEQKRFWKLSINGMLQTFIATIIQRVTQKDAESEDVCIGDEIIKYITENYMHPLNNREIAKRFHYNSDHINRIIFSYTGMTLKQYIINLKIRSAINLLIHTDLDISEIAASVGYPNVYYFSRIFKKKTGYTPSYFRQCIKN